MQSVPSTLAARLDALQAAGTIAGWQDAGGPNAGLSQAPLPALIFPANGGGALTFYGPATLRAAIIALETFGPLAGSSVQVER